MNNAQELGRRVARLEKILEGLLTPQLTNSTIDGGALKLRDGEQLVGAVGRQYDGTFGSSTLAGPVPPAPRWTSKWGPAAEWMSLGLRVRWEGYFEPDDLTVAPMDYAHVEVHASNDPGLSGLLFETLKGNITSARGGELFLRLPTLPAGQAYYLRMITRATSGKVSAASDVIGPIVSTGIISGDPNGAHTEQGDSGFISYDIGPDGQLIQSGSMGTGNNSFTSIDPATGETTMAFIDGEGSLQTLAVAGRDLDGDGMSESGLTIYGRDFTDWLADQPRGLEASAFAGNAANGVFASGITTPFGLGEVSFTNDPTRQYLLIFTGLHFGSTVAGDRVLITLRGTVDGSTPTISNGSIYGSSFLYIPVSSQAFTAPPIIVNGTFAASVAEARILVVAQRFSGTGSVTAYTYTTADAFSSPFRLFPIDIGPNIPDTYIANDGGGVRAGGTPSAVTKKRYTSTWGSTFVGAYLGDGSRRTDTSDVMQGYTPYYTAAGTEKSIAGFMGTASYGEVGKTVAQALAGASISKVEVFLHCNHSDSMAGGTARIGYHGNTSLPGTAPNSSYESFGSAFFKRGESRWITLPASTYASWLNGTYRGITVGPGPAGDRNYYMRFDGAGASRPALRITYTR